MKYLHQKLWKISQKRIQCSSNTRLKVPLQIPFWKCSKEKGYSKISKFPSSLRKCVPFSLTLQGCKAKFPTSTKTDPNKSVSCEFCLETVKMKAFYESSRITIEILQASKRNTSHKISRRTSLVDSDRCLMYYL